VSDWFAMLGLDLAETMGALSTMNAAGLGRFRVEGQVVELVLHDWGAYHDDVTP
jgi:hypothetical protein